MTLTVHEPDVVDPVRLEALVRALTYHAEGAPVDVVLATAERFAAFLASKES